MEIGKGKIAEQLINFGFWGFKKVNLGFSPRSGEIFWVIYLGFSAAEGGEILFGLFFGFFAAEGGQILGFWVLKR